MPTHPATRHRLILGGHCEPCHFFLEEKYKSAAEEFQGSSTLCVSHDMPMNRCSLVTLSLTGLHCTCVLNWCSLLHGEYAAYQKRLASRHATKWEKTCSTVMAWVRVSTQFAVFSTINQLPKNLRLRGSVVV